MPHAEHTVTIARPQKDVFDYLAEGTHNREWRAGVLEISRTSAADGQGATYRQVPAARAGASTATTRSPSLTRRGGWSSRSPPARPARRGCSS